MGCHPVLLEHIVAKGVGLPQPLEHFVPEDLVAHLSIALFIFGKDDCQHPLSVTGQDTQKNIIFCRCFVVQMNSTSSLSTASQQLLLQL